MTKEDLKRHAISAGITFVATFAFFFFGLVATESFKFSWDALYAASLGAFIAATRAVAKIIYEWAAELLSSKKE